LFAIWDSEQNVNLDDSTIKILQGSVVSQTTLGGLTKLYILKLQISYSVHMPKTIKVG